MSKVGGRTAVIGRAQRLPLSVKKLTPDSAEYAAKVERVVRDFMSAFKKDATEKEIKSAINKIISSSKKSNTAYSRREIQEKLYF